MLSVVMLSVVMLSVVMLSAEYHWPLNTKEWQYITTALSYNTELLSNDSKLTYLKDAKVSNTAVIYIVMR